ASVHFEVLHAFGDGAVVVRPLAASRGHLHARRKQGSAVPGEDAVPLLVESRDPLSQARTPYPSSVGPSTAAPAASPKKTRVVRSSGSVSRDSASAPIASTAWVFLLCSRCAPKRIA